MRPNAQIWQLNTTHQPSASPPNLHAYCITLSSAHPIQDTRSKSLLYLNELVFIKSKFLLEGNWLLFLVEGSSIVGVGAHLCVQLIMHNAFFFFEMIMHNANLIIENNLC